MRWRRLVDHLFGGWFRLRRQFPAALLDEVTAAIAAGERTHKGEVRFAIESRWPLSEVLAGLEPAQRAQQVFGQLRVWDTEHNSGVLIYLLLAEQRIEIVADRGIAAHVASAEWQAICHRMHQQFSVGHWREGTLGGIAASHAVLRRHFPDNEKNQPDELPDRPVLL